VRIPCFLPFAACRARLRRANFLTPRTGALVKYWLLGSIPFDAATRACERVVTPFEISTERSMTLVSLEQGAKWVAQFQEHDRPLASDLITGLYLVSANEFRRTITQLAEKIAEQSESPIAAYAIREATASPFFPDRKRAPRLAPSRRVGSEGLVANIISTWSDGNPESFLNHPPISTLKKKEVRDIVLVDDIVGSGKRASDFLRSFMRSPTLRSWRSYGLLRIHVLAYAASHVGERKTREALATKKKPGLAGNVDVQFVRRPGLYGQLALPMTAESIKLLCAGYGKNHKIPFKYHLGFGNALSTIVFEHKCPNTAPGILWHKTKTWTPLFPGGAVPHSLTPAFNEGQLLARRKASAALFLKADAQELERLTSGEGVKLLLTLGALAKLRNEARVAEAVDLPLLEIQRLLQVAQQAGFVSGRSLTAEGRAELHHAKKLGFFLKKCVHPPAHSSILVVVAAREESLEYRSRRL